MHEMNASSQTDATKSIRQQLEELKAERTRKKEMQEIIMNHPVIESLKKMHEEAIRFFENLDEMHTTREVLEARQTVVEVVDIKNSIIGNCLDHDTTVIDLDKLAHDIAEVQESMKADPPHFDVKREQSFALANVLSALSNIIITLRKPA